MACLVSNSKKFYQKVLQDVWGSYSAYKWKEDDVLSYMNKMLKSKENLRSYLSQPFTYSMKKMIWYKMPKSLDKNFMDMSYLKNYYLILSSVNFMKFSKQSSKKGGFLMQNYLMFLEGSLFMILYSSNWISNLFIIKSMIDLKLFYVNFKLISWSNYNLSVGDMVTMDKKFYNLLKNDLKMSLKKNVIYFYHPYYLFVNYKLMFIFLMSKPKKEEMLYPVAMDFYKGFDFF